MPRGLVLPGSSTPANLSLPPGARAHVLESDVYDICNRLRTEVEGGDRITIVVHEDHKQPYVFMEHNDRGEDDFIYRTDTLDARCLEKLRYMRAVPVSERLAKVEREEAAEAEAAKEAELEELYDRQGRPMLTQLEHDGFIQRPVSYPKLGVTSHGRRAR